MCGIAGFLQLDGSAASYSLVKQMTDAIAHRGPDGEGQQVIGAAGLGQRRLAIIDLSPAGKQPMCNEDETIWITYNGEIYNFEEVRVELLQKGHQFHSRTDTEVIVHAYEEWGVDCLKRFNGMFAFALWDSRRELLWLVRDRLGVKPLFYTHLPGRAVLFGSEIKALLAYPGVERTINYQALAYYLALNYTPAPHTLFAGIQQVMPGHYLLVNNEGQIRDVEYWDVQYREDFPRRSEADYLEEFRSLLSDSIRLRLVSDVPFGAFLSGGVDSSSVAYWMSQHMQEPVKTFSISFGESTFDEVQYARQIATQIGADYHERIVNADAASLLPRIVWHAEEPTADSSMVAVYYLAQLAREHVTMALSGDGADEIMAGYETHQAYYLHQLYQRIPGWLRHRVIAPMVNGLPVSDSKVSLDFKLRRFVRSGELSADEAHASWRMIFNADMRRELLKPVSSEAGIHADAVDLYHDYFARTNARRPLNRMLYVDTRLYLPNDMLVKVDRMAMAHGLEAREPFLDYRLVEFVASVPPELKLKHLRHKKYMLKKAMQGRLPDNILWRKKAGFNVPNARWIRQSLKPFVTDHLSESRVREMGLLDSGVVQRLLSEHFNGTADHSHQIWCVLSLALWWEHFQKEPSQVVMA